MVVCYEDLSVVASKDCSGDSTSATSSLDLRTREAIMEESDHHLRYGQ